MNQKQIVDLVKAKLGAEVNFHPNYPFGPEIVSDDIEVSKGSRSVIIGLDFTGKRLLLHFTQPQIFSGEYIDQDSKKTRKDLADFEQIVFATNEQDKSNMLVIQKSNIITFSCNVVLPGEKNFIAILNFIKSYLAK